MAWFTKIKIAISLSLFVLFACFSLSARAANNNDFVRGIYVTESSMVDTPYLTYLVNHAKAVGINTFVVDMDGASKVYEKNVQLLKQNGIHYVARIVIFPNGGTPERVHSIPYREKKYRLVQTAIAYGADAIQLDYIRYNTAQGSSSRHAVDINNVIGWFRQRIPQHIPLQIDVFGIASFGEEKNIGQSLPLIARNADVLCPMNYPSHFEPFAKHSKDPYGTIYTAMTALKKQFNNRLPVKVIVWIEASNYRYAYSAAYKQKYLAAQMKAVHDSGAHGWYVWSPSNYYDNLFRMMAKKGSTLN